MIECFTHHDKSLIQQIFFQNLLSPLNSAKPLITKKKHFTLASDLQLKTTNVTLHSLKIDILMKASLNEHTKYNDKLSFYFMKIIFFEWWICGNHFYNYFKAILQCSLMMHSLKILPILFNFTVNKSFVYLRLFWRRINLNLPLLQRCKYVLKSFKIYCKQLEINQHGSATKRAQMNILITNVWLVPRMEEDL